MGAGKNKVLLELSGVPILLRSLQAFSAVAEVGQLIVVVAAGEVALVEGLFRNVQGLKPWCVVAGGAERQYSVANGMKHLAASSDIVLVHDAARPLVSRETIEAIISAAREKGAAIAAVRAKNTIKVVDPEGRVEATPPREQLWEVQTPQGFRRELLLAAYERAAADGFLGTDDASLVERLGVPVRIVRGEYSNIKVTTPEDMVVAEAILRNDMGAGELMKTAVHEAKRLLGGVVRCRKGEEE